MSYGNYPSAPPPAEWQRPAAELEERPPSVVLAVRLLYLNVAVGLIGLIVLFATRDDLKKRILKDTPDATDSTVNAALAIGAVVAIVFLVLYALLAWQVGRGKSWARITTWVLAGLGVVSGLAGMAQPEPTASRVLGVVGLVIDVVVIVLLARPDSNRYFKPGRAH
jgi:hypothetical protein